MNDITRFSTAPTNITEIKANIFSYYTKNKVEFKKDETLIHEDDCFKVELKGYKLNQIHKDILDIILYHGGKEFDGKLKDNSFVRTISLYKIKQHLGYTSSNNIKWIESKIDEMQQTLIQVANKKTAEKWKFAIIHTAKHSTKLNTYAIVIHPLYYNFFQSNISINYSYYLQNILSLKNGITKACIRYLLTHKTGHQININNLLKKIGVNGTKRNLNKQKAKLLNELKEVKETFNIQLIKTTDDSRKNSDITIKYTRLPQIKFYYQKK